MTWRPDAGLWLALALAAAAPVHADALTESGSSYLAQHADNPINWRPWTPSALEHAVANDQLVFLSIGYASCHWCHVMERESFMDPAVADALSRNYVAIKVDREQRPDIDAWYSRVAEAAVGEAGWPVTAILLPDLTPVFAAHYLEREALLTTLERLAVSWNNNRDHLHQRGRLMAAVLDEGGGQHESAQLDDTKQALDRLADSAEQQLLQMADTAHGGFGVAQKFPDEMRLRFLLDHYRVSRDPALRQTLTRLLDAQVSSGLTDAVFGGVFRYTVDPEMTRPHFEKMLYNQALSASLYFEAGRWLDRPDYVRFARDIIAFTRSTLRLPDGRYGTAVDAEHDGVEGGYYTWDPVSLPPTPEGVRAVPAGHGIFLAGMARGPGTDEWRSTLAQRREGPPRVISNPVTAWNALWLVSLVDAGETRDAIALGETLWRTAWTKNGLVRFGTQPGFLDDYAYLAAAYRRLYLVTTDTRWRHRADQLDHAIFARFISANGLRFSPVASDVPDTVDPARDAETPAPLPFVVESFRAQAGQPDLADAIPILLTAAINSATRMPAYYTGLARLALSPPTSRRTVANSRGTLALSPTDPTATKTRAWHLEVALEPGWHINASMVNEAHLIPTRIVSSSPSVTATFPPGRALNTRFSEIPLNVYSERVTIPLTSKPATNTLALTIRIQACNDRVCLAPELVALDSTTAAPP